jgi:hypothetical protein
MNAVLGGHQQEYAESRRQQDRQDGEARGDQVTGSGEARHQEPEQGIEYGDAVLEAVERPFGGVLAALRVGGGGVLGQRTTARLVHHRDGNAGA